MYAKVDNAMYFANILFSSIRYTPHILQILIVGPKKQKKQLQHYDKVLAIHTDAAAAVFLSGAICSPVTVVIAYSCCNRCRLHKCILAICNLQLQCIPLLSCCEPLLCERIQSNLCSDCDTRNCLGKRGQIDLMTPISRD